ncbi:MAG: hypothetical protein Q3972_08420 [Corynebacterium sp.]|nr:hypothetical protein [Corynebacterium sp.]
MSDFKGVLRPTGASQRFGRLALAAGLSLATCASVVVAPQMGAVAHADTATSAAAPSDIQRLVVTINGRYTSLARLSDATIINSVVNALKSDNNELVSATQPYGFAYSAFLVNGEKTLINVATSYAQVMSALNAIKTAPSGSAAAISYTQLKESASLARISLTNADNIFPELKGAHYDQYLTTRKVAANLVDIISIREAEADTLYRLLNTKPTTTAPSTSNPSTTTTPEASKPEEPSTSEPVVEPVDPTTSQEPSDEGKDRSGEHATIDGVLNRLTAAVEEFNNALKAVPTGNDSADYSAVTVAGDNIIKAATAVQAAASTISDPDSVTTNAVTAAQQAVAISNFVQAALEARNNKSLATVLEYSQMFYDTAHLSADRASNVYAELVSAFSAVSDYGYTDGVLAALKDTTTIITDFVNTLSVPELPSRETFGIMQKAEEALERMTEAVDALINGTAEERERATRYMENGSAAGRATAVEMQRQGTYGTYVNDVANASTALYNAAEAYNTICVAYAQLSMPNVTPEQASSAITSVRDAIADSDRAVATIKTIVENHPGKALLVTTQENIQKIDALSQDLAPKAIASAEKLLTEAMQKSAQEAIENANKSSSSEDTKDAKEAAAAAKAAGEQANKNAELLGDDVSKAIAETVHASVVGTQSVVDARVARDALDGLFDGDAATRYAKQAAAAAAAAAQAAKDAAEAYSRTNNSAEALRAKELAEHAAEQAQQAAEAASARAKEIVENYNAVVAAQAKAKNTVEASGLSVSTKAEAVDAINAATTVAAVEAVANLVFAKANAVAALNQSTSLDAATRQSYIREAEAAKTIAEVEAILSRQGVGVSGYTNVDLSQNNNGKDVNQTTGSSKSIWTVIIIGILSLLGIGGAAVAYLQSTGQLPH